VPDRAVPFVLPWACRDSARGRLFFGFMLATAALLSASKMPYMLDSLPFEEPDEDDQQQQQPAYEGSSGGGHQSSTGTCVQPLSPQPQPRTQPLLSEQEEEHYICCLADCGPTFDFPCIRAGSVGIERGLPWRRRAVDRAIQAVETHVSPDTAGSVLQHNLVHEVRHSCACIGSPCLRHCVHGASIGGRGVRGAALLRLPPLHVSTSQRPRSRLADTSAR
jgi:hypothetical protein